MNIDDNVFLKDVRGSMKQLDESMRTPPTLLSPHDAIVKLNDELQLAMQKGDLQKAKLISEAFKLVPDNDLRAVLHPIAPELKEAGIKFTKHYLETASNHDQLEVLENAKMLFEAFRITSDEAKLLLAERIKYVLASDAMDPWDMIKFLLKRQKSIFNFFYFFFVIF